MDKKITFSSITFLAFIICLTGIGRAGTASMNNHSAATDGLTLRHVSFTKPSTQEEQEAVKALGSNWKNLPHDEELFKNWNEPEFRKKIQLTCASVDLNQDLKKEILVRLVLHGEDTCLCIQQNCLTFLMEKKKEKWEPDLHSYIMANNTIDVTNQYNNGYATFQTPSFITGKGYKYTYDSIYSGEVVDLVTKPTKKTSDTTSRPGTNKILYRLNLKEKTTDETREAVDSFRSQLASLAPYTLADVNNWDDPAFKARLIITSEAVDLNRDGVKEVLIRLDTKGEDREFCMTFHRITTCETYIMQLKNGKWQRITRGPFMSINKIIVKDRYNHGFADLVITGATFEYDERLRLYVVNERKNRAVTLDDQKKQKIQTMLDHNAALNQHGIQFRVIGVANGLVFLDMYQGNQKIRKKILTDQNYDFTSESSPDFNEQDMKDLKLIRKVVTDISKMDNIQLVQIRPGTPDGKMLLPRGKRIHQVYLASGKQLEDIGFSIRATSYFWDDAGQLHVPMTLFDGNQTIKKGEADPFNPLAYKDVVIYPAGLIAEDSVEVHLKEIKTGKMALCILKKGRKCNWKAGKAVIGVLNIDKQNKVIKRAKIRVKANGKTMTHWIKIGQENKLADTPYKIFIRQTRNPVLNLYFNPEKHK